MTWLAFPLAMLLCAGALAIALRRGGRTRFIDHPNERSLHSTPTPRFAGLLLHPAWMLACVVSFTAGSALPDLIAPAAALAWICLFALSAADDAFDLPVRVRLPAHLLLAALGVWALARGAPQPPAAWQLVMWWLATAWMLNLYNFMDGANGLAGGMTLIGFGALAVAALPADVALATICLAVAGAAAGFLLFNFDPARVFLGDAGSVPLGALAAFLSLAGVVRGVWSPWLPLLVFLPFIADASLTLLRRVLRGERIWQAHREHSYQKLVRMGWSHRRLSLIAYCLMLITSGLALILDKMSQMAILLGMLLAGSSMVILVAAIERLWSRTRKPG